MVSGDDRFLRLSRDLIYRSGSSEGQFAFSTETSKTLAHVGNKDDDEQRSKWLDSFSVAVRQPAILDVIGHTMAIEDFDDILPHVGSFGRFQKRIFVFSLPINVFLAVVYFSQIYQTLTPEHWCAVPELSHLDPEVRRNLSIPLEVREGQLVYSRCSMFDINFTEVELCPISIGLLFICKRNTARLDYTG